MVMDVINVGHLIWCVACQVVYFVLDVTHATERALRIDWLIRSVFPSLTLLVPMANRRILLRNTLHCGASLFYIITSFFFPVVIH